MRRRLLAALALLLAALLLAALAGRSSEPNQPSSYSHRSRGLLAAWRYLEARGTDVRRWERPLTELEGAGTLVIALPLQVALRPEELEALSRWRIQGGEVLLLAGPDEPGHGERELLAELGLFPDKRELGDAPLLWWSWKEWRGTPADLTPLREGWPGPAVALPGDWSVRPLSEAEILYRDPSGAPAIYRRQDPGRGDVTVVDNASVLANAWLGAGENLALLEQLTPRGPIWFDEWHQGFQLAEEGPSELLTPVALAGLHLLFLYLAVAWTVSRPFAPPNPPLPARQGSIHRDLLALADLHRQGGHAAQAGARMLEIARELAGARARELGLPERFSGGEAELLALARQIGRLQAEGRL